MWVTGTLVCREIMGHCHPLVEIVRLYLQSSIHGRREDTMHKTPILTIAAAVTAGLLFAACGADADAEALSKPEFIAQANAICRASNDEAEPFFDEIYADLPDEDFDDPANGFVIFVRWDEALDSVKPIFDKQLDDIRDLEPPAEDKQLIDTLIADQQAALDNFQRDIAAAATGDQAALAALDTEEDPFEDIDRRAREYGLTVCGEADD
jgi:hypothetical protein